MEGPRDITDEFDDDALRASIEKADKQGQWRDANQSFVDPKIEALRKQLSEPPRESYTERRLRDLQKKAATAVTPQKKEAAGDKAAQEKAALESAFADAPSTFVDDRWRGPGTGPISFDEAAAHLSSPFNTGAPAPTAPATAAAAPAAASAAAKPTETVVVQTPAKPLAVAPAPVETRFVPARKTNPVVEQFLLVVPGLMVFAPVALLQLMLGTWRYDVLLRVPIASAIAGVAWHKLDADRMRAGAIGGGVHVLTFFATSLAWSTRDIMANIFGLMAAIVGSGIIGMIRESSTDGMFGSRR